MDFKQHFLTAWNLMLRFIVPLVLSTLVLLAVSGVTFMVLAPVLTAGYMHSILRMIREGREPRIQDLFSQMRLFLPLLLFSAAALVVVVIGLFLLVLPGIAVAAGLTFVCLYMLPLMADRDLGLVDAVKASFAMVSRDQVGEQAIAALLFVGISALGSSVILSLFTQPFATIFLMSVYEERARKFFSSQPQPPSFPGPASNVDLRK